jgi:hypothetical protein
VQVPYPQRFSALNQQKQTLDDKAVTAVTGTKGKSFAPLGKIPRLGQAGGHSGRKMKKAAG